MPGVRQTEGSYVAGRVSGLWHELLSPHYMNPTTGRIGSVALALLVVAGALLGRRRPSEARHVFVLLVGGAAVMAANAVLSPGSTVTGLLAAWPVAMVGLVGWRWRSATATERMLAAVVVVFTLGVAATVYAEGGGIEWGGRFLSPAIVPLAVLAAAALQRTLAAATSAVDRRALWAGLAIVTIVPAVIGLNAVRSMRSTNAAFVAEVRRSGAPVVVTNSPALPRNAWADASQVTWLLAEPVDVADAVGRLREAGLPTVAVVEPAGLPTGSLAAYPTVSRVPAPRLARAGYQLLLLRG